MVTGKPQTRAYLQRAMNTGFNDSHKTKPTTQAKYFTVLLVSEWESSLAAADFFWNTVYK